DRVVDLVRAGVVEVLALEVDRMASALAESAGFVQRRGPTHVVAQQRAELAVEIRVIARRQPRGLELGQRRHQRLGHVLTAVGTEAMLDRAHADPTGTVERTASANARSFCGSFRPGLSSTPLATSTANGWTAEIASATLSGFRPPDRITGIFPRC